MHVLLPLSGARSPPRKGGDRVNLSTILDQVGYWTTALADMYDTLSTIWIVFVPLGMTVFSFVLAKLLGILQFRRRSRRGR